MENSKRPTFLTVLCILSFIGGAWGIFSGISSYLAAGASSSVLSEAQKTIEAAADSTKMALDSLASDSTASKLDMAGAETGANIANNILSGISDAMSEKNIKNNALAGILSSILSLIGAFFMFNLKKKGYWIYLAAVAIGIIAPLVIYGGGFMGVLNAGWQVLSGILFAVLYALNLKHMA